MTIGRYSSAFSGYSQQDSQEFLAFLLDGLHEDLNRIKNKPATEKPELAEDKVKDLEAISALANECWELHKKRNDSVILDLFAGLYRSVLVCPDCQKVSITFDPFMDLTLPLPSDNLWIKDMVIVPLKGRPIIYEVAMDVHSTIRQLKEYIVKRLGMTKNGGADRLQCAEVYNFRFHTEHEDRDIVSLKIQPNDSVIIYELDRPWVVDGDDDDVFLVPVYNRTTRSVRVDARKPPGTSETGGRYFGIPFFITLTSKEAKDEEIIKARISERYKELRGRKEDDAVIDLESETDGEVMEIEPESDEVMEIEPESGEGDGTEYEPAEAEETEPESTTVNETKYIPESNSFDISFIENGRRRMVGVYSSYARNSKPLSSRKFLETSSSSSSASSLNELAVNTNASSTTSTPSHLDMNSKIHPPSVADNNEISDSEVDDNLVSLIDVNIDTDQGEVIPSYEESQAVSVAAASASAATNGNQDYDGEQERDLPQLIFPNEIIVCDWQDNLIEDWEPERVRNQEAEEMRIAKETQKKTVIELNDCLDLFSKTEVLGQDDLWYCSKCKCLRQATKTIDLWRVPDIFTIHLKRFSSFRSFRDKISYVVNFPIEGLDMSSRVADKDSYKEGELIYDLIAVDNHYGGLGGGHYTAFAKNFVDDKWYYYDDSNVRAADPEKAISGAAYLLFYRRRTAGPLGGESMKKMVEEAREKLNNPPPKRESMFGRSSGGSSGHSSGWNNSDRDNYLGRTTRPRAGPAMVTGDRFYGEGKTLGSVNDSSIVPSRPWDTEGPVAFGGPRGFNSRVGHSFGKTDESDGDSSASSPGNDMSVTNDEEDEEDEEFEDDSVTSE